MKIMTSWQKIVWISVVSLLFAGCATTPLDLGISERQWEEFSPEKQQQLLNNYEQIESESSSKSNDNEPYLAVSIHGGEVMMPPFITWTRYREAKIVLAKETCEDSKLESSDTQNHIMLKVCYYGKVLALDPTKYDLATSKGTVSFTWSPLWRRGFAYKNIDTDGYARLKNATIEVKLLSKTVYERKSHKSAKLRQIESYKDNSTNE